MLGLLLTLGFFGTPGSALANDRLDSTPAVEHDFSKNEVGVVFGEQYDPDLGLYYLRARYYSTQLGRFWSMDPYEGNRSRPGTLHKYTYVENQPTRFIDPSGYCAVSTSTSISVSLSMASIGMTAMLLTPSQTGVQSNASQFELKRIAENLGAELEAPVSLKLLESGAHTDTSVKSDRRENGRGQYFLHGTSTGSWSISTTGIKMRGEGEFGKGFYTFRESLQGYILAAKRAINDGGTPFILRVRVSNQDFQRHWRNRLDLRHHMLRWLHEVTFHKDNNGTQTTGHWRCPLNRSTYDVSPSGFLFWFGSSPTEGGGADRSRA